MENNNFQNYIDCLHETIAILEEIMDSKSNLVETTRTQGDYEVVIRTETTIATNFGLYCSADCRHLVRRRTHCNLYNEHVGIKSENAKPHRCEKCKNAIPLEYKSLNKVGLL